MAVVVEGLVLVGVGGGLVEDTNLGGRWGKNLTCLYKLLYALIKCYI